MNFPSRVRVALVSGVACAVLSPMAHVQMAYAQSSSSNETQYHSLLTQISNAKLNIAHQELYVFKQDETLKGLKKQMVGLDAVKASVDPMLSKMTVGLDTQINGDYPFKLEERMSRLQSLKDTVGDKDGSIANKYRKVLSAYTIEVNYGNSVEVYAADHPVHPTNRVGDDRFLKTETGELIMTKSGDRIMLFDGYYLRFGRMSFIYQNQDGTDALQYDLKKKEWVKLPSGKSLVVRQAIQAARGEIAPRVVFAPVSPMP